MSSSDRLPEPWRRRLYLPAYLNKEAAELAGVSPQTVARWHHGYEEEAAFVKPEFGRPPPRRPRRSIRVFARETAHRTPLSYLQLVEVAIVATWRRHGVPLKNIRTAHSYLCTVFKAEYPFATLRLRQMGPHILKDLDDYDTRVGSVILADAGGQLMWSELMMDRFEEFDYEYDLALQWHPRGRDVPIIVNPRIAFGAPIIERVAIPTAIVRERYDAGETFEELQEDFGLEENEIKQALWFEGVTTQAA